MKRYRVTIAPVVVEQIRAQVLHVAADSIDNAFAWEDRLNQAIRNLGEMPGFAVDEEASARRGYSVRKYVFENTYPVHFAVDETAGVVQIVNFRHGARLPRQNGP